MRASLAAAASLVLTAAAFASPTSAADVAILKAAYTIWLGFIPIGHIDVESHFTGDSYSVEIEGETIGLGKLVSSSAAVLRGNGTIAGTRVTPATFTLDTTKGEPTHARVTMQDGSVAMVEAEPALKVKPDRPAVPPGDLQQVLDPVGALIVAVGDASAGGQGICNRSVPVFDGWYRYDIELSFKETQTVTGPSGSYSGPSIVCQARYIPVAGQRSKDATPQYLAQDKRLEVGLYPVKNTSLMVVSSAIIGTPAGDLRVSNDSFVVTNP